MKDRKAVLVRKNLAVAVVCAAVLGGANATAQESRQNSGRNMVMSKCFQCHTDAMFRDQSQDKRAWEAAIYRMVGRGGLWTPDEINAMAEYLGAEFGAKQGARGQ
jgi:mono/diheme cytochrome c family protein